jgi:ATP synthase protein I
MAGEKKLTSPEEELRRKVASQAKRMKLADRERPTLLAQTVYVGTLGLLFVLPLVVGAYVGRWLDGLLEGYSMRWTLSLILVGVVVGGFNVYLFVKE